MTQASNDRKKSVAAFLRSIYLTSPSGEGLLQENHLKGEELLLERLKQEPKYRGDVSGIVLERHATAAGIRPLAESVKRIVASLIYALESDAIITDVALLKNGLPPGMMPHHPAAKLGVDRHFAIIKTPLVPMVRGTVPKLPEHYEVLDPDGPLGLQGIVVEKIDSLDGKPIVRLHLSIYEGLLQYFSIETTGIMKMCRSGSAVDMNSFIDIGLFFNLHPFDPELENAFDNIDWRVAIVRGEDDGDEFEDLFYKIPQWMPKMEQVIRALVDLNKHPGHLRD